MTARKRTDRRVWRGPSPTLPCGGVPAHHPGFRSGVESSLWLYHSAGKSPTLSIRGLCWLLIPRCAEQREAVDPDETPVMVPAAPFMQNGLIEKTIHKRVQYGGYRTEPRPPGLSGSIHKSNTFACGAGIIRETVISVSFIWIAPFLRRRSHQGGPCAGSRIARNRGPTAQRVAEAGRRVRVCFPGHDACASQAPRVQESGRVCKTRSTTWGTALRHLRFVPGRLRDEQ